MQAASAAPLHNCVSVGSLPQCNVGRPLEMDLVSRHLTDSTTFSPTNGHCNCGLIQRVVFGLEECFVDGTIRSSQEVISLLRTHHQIRAKMKTWRGPCRPSTMGFRPPTNDASTTSDIIPFPQSLVPLRLSLAAESPAGRLSREVELSNASPSHFAATVVYSCQPGMSPAPLAVSIGSVLKPWDATSEPGRRRWACIVVGLPASSLLSWSPVSSSQVA